MNGKLVIVAGSKLSLTKTETFEPVSILGLSIYAIAMAYIDSPSIETGSKVSVLVRDNLLPATITNLPFISPNYKRT